MTTGTSWINITGSDIAQLMRLKIVGELTFFLQKNRNV